MSAHRDGAAAEAPRPSATSSTEAAAGAGRCLVGIFDSGLGGLTVVAALHRMAPALSVRYVADTAHFPYGDQPDEVVAQRARTIAGELVAAGCRLLVVACNTASSAALELLRAELSEGPTGVPIVGMEPPLKPAVARSRNGRVAVLVTQATAEGDRLARLQRQHAGNSAVLTVPMPGLADLVEGGVVSGPEVDRALAEPLAGVGRADVDAVALGCTHYGFLRESIANALGPGVEVLDAAEPVARRVLHQLAEFGIVVPDGPPVQVLCSATGDSEAFEAALTRLRAAGVDLPPLQVMREAPA